MIRACSRSLDVNTELAFQSRACAGFFHCYWTYTALLVCYTGFERLCLLVLAFRKHLRMVEFRMHRAHPSRSTHILKLLDSTQALHRPLGQQQDCHNSRRGHMEAHQVLHTFAHPYRRVLAVPRRKCLASYMGTGFHTVPMPMPTLGMFVQSCIASMPMLELKTCHRLLRIRSDWES